MADDRMGGNRCARGGGLRSSGILKLQKYFDCNFGRPKVRRVEGWAKGGGSGAGFVSRMPPPSGDGFHWNPYP